MQPWASRHDTLARMAARGPGPVDDRPLRVRIREFREIDPGRSWRLLAVTVVLLSVAWKNRDGEWMQSFTSTHRSQDQPAIRFDNDAPDSGAPSAGLSPAQATQTARPVGLAHAAQAA